MNNNWPRKIALVVLVLVALLMQHAVLQNLDLTRYGINLLFIFVVFGALLDGYRFGITSALVCGLLEDLACGRYIGISALTWVVAALVVAWLGYKFHKANYILPFAVTVIAAFVSQLLMAFGLMVLNGYYYGFSVIMHGIALAMLNNALVALLLYLPVYKSYTEGVLRHRSLEDENSVDKFKLT